MEHVIRPLVISRISLDKSLMTYLANIGTPISIPVVAWYVHADGKDVLIDTGATKECIDTYWPAGSQHVKTFEEALGQVGKKPEDIDMIICDALQAFDSALKVKEMADILIPLHEESFANAERIPICG